MQSIGMRFSNYSEINGKKKSNFRNISFANLEQQKVSEIQNKKPKVGWVLGGGGARCAFEAGAIKALVDANILPDFMQTLSFGTVNAGISLGHKDGIKALADYWLNMSKEKIFNLKLKCSSIFDNSPLRNFITKNIDPVKALENNSLGNPEIIVQTAELTPKGPVKTIFATEKSYEKLKQRFKNDENSVRICKLTKDNLHKVIMSSVTIPVAVPPEKIDNKLYMDCGAISHPYLQDGLITLASLKDKDQKGVLIVILNRDPGEYDEKISLRELKKLGLSFDDFANVKPIIITPRFQDISIFGFDKAGKEASKSIQFGYMETVDALYRAKLIDREKYVSLNRNLNLVA